MKLKMGLVLVAASSLLPLLSLADEQFALSWRGTVYTTSAEGRVVAHSYSDRDVIRVIAADQGLDPRDLILVYRPSRFDTAVVRKTTGEFIADYLQIPDNTSPFHTDVTNTNGTQTARQAFLFDERHGTSANKANAIGSIFATEKQRIDPTSGAVLSESFHGTFNFAVSVTDDPLLQPGVYTGTFSTGRRIAGP